LEIRLELGATAEPVRERLPQVDVEQLSLADQVVDAAVDALKFQDALPTVLATKVVVERLRADDEVRWVLDQSVKAVRG